MCELRYARLGPRRPEMRLLLSRNGYVRCILYTRRDRGAARASNSAELMVEGSTAASRWGNAVTRRALTWSLSLWDCGGACGPRRRMLCPSRGRRPCRVAMLCRAARYRDRYRDRSRYSFDIRLAIFGTVARGRAAISSRMLVLRYSLWGTWSEICGMAKLRYVRCMAH